MATLDVARMPVLYLSHGAPPLADDERWSAELSGWAAQLPRPTSILMVSAHWEQAPVTLSATRTVPLVYDFWGFPERYYDVTYPAPGAPELAASVRALLSAPSRPVHDEPERGLDHGAYVPLVEMYPDADVPTLQLSMPSLDPQALFDLGRRLAPLRDDGVLILGSGFTTHNLGEMAPAEDGRRRPGRWSSTSGWMRRWPSWTWTRYSTSSGGRRQPTWRIRAPNILPRCSYPWAPRSARPRTRIGMR